MNIDILMDLVRPYLSPINPKIKDPKGRTITAALRMAKKPSSCLSCSISGKKFCARILADKPNKA